MCVDFLHVRVDTVVFFPDSNILVVRYNLSFVLKSQKVLFQPRRQQIFVKVARKVDKRGTCKALCKIYITLAAITNT